ncbi:hypothetical protein EZS27_015873 [termite gut metagenome]|uniref:Uncharacterized protein n=1 Tax=termite gut metagenome TaxID=433724 RepID=A0A5J4RSG0_9ZZZZ
MIKKILCYLLKNKKVARRKADAATPICRRFGNRHANVQ